jgi:hypothetical protein
MGEKEECCIILPMDRVSFFFFLLCSKSDENLCMIVTTDVEYMDHRGILFVLMKIGGK